MLDLQIHSDIDQETFQRMLADHLSVIDAVRNGEARYSASEGWLHPGECAGEAQITRIEKKAQEIQANADAFVPVGVGGSINSARAVIEALKPQGYPQIIYAGNTLNAHALNGILQSLEGRTFYIDCIAKNFETLEPGASFRLLRKMLQEEFGEEAYKKIITTGTPGSLLEKLSGAQGWDFFDFPVNVGGRYTALTNVGLLPMAVAGIDIRALVQGAEDMRSRLFAEEGEDNIAYRYACLRNLFYREGKRVEMLSSFEPRFRYFYKWWMQLFGESEGKDGRGILPVTGEFSEELHSIGQFIQDGSPVMFETFLHVKNPSDDSDCLPVPDDGIADAFDYLNGKDFLDINEADYEATVKAHSTGLPVLSVEVDRLDAYTFGELFYFFEAACVMSCEIMGVNPFDQPGVEAYKLRMFAALGKNHQKERDL